ncbi:MAG: hypothetical protein IPK33_11915 [Gemmatimonadetes bacterium]|nr:hypothetical protein [Gemmatimonadota bacterium]
MKAAIRTVTFDTNVLPAPDLIERARALGIEVAVSTVTVREVDDTSWSEAVSDLPRHSEVFVLGESLMGEAVLPIVGPGDVLEEIIRLVSGGSFPRRGGREQLTRGQANQLRDAMILETHVRSGRDALVTADSRAFIKFGRREALQERFGTSILLPPEFAQYLDTARARDAV